MFGECHAHMIMDGINYKNAVQRHSHGVQDEMIHNCFAAYKEKEIFFIRDGGDSYGVSKRAKELAKVYGIDYRTPIFAIHKEGHYGGIVGKSFADMKEFKERVLEAKREGADFIKIMTTGIMDFNRQGEITGTPLEAEEVKEMVLIAHEEGMAIMSHTNGVYGVQAAIQAGADSIEHGNFIDKETIDMLVESESVWIPTQVTVKNLLGCGRFSDEVIRSIMKVTEKNIRYAFEKKAKVALGSDAGAYQVFHGQGTIDEFNAFRDILGDNLEVHQWLRNGEQIIKEKFIVKRY